MNFKVFVRRGKNKVLGFSAKVARTLQINSLIVLFLYELKYKNVSSTHFKQTHTAIYCIVLKNNRNYVATSPN